MSVSIVTVLHDWSQFYKLFDYHWNNIDYPKENLEWIIIDDSKNDHSEHIPIHENILYIRLESKDFLDKIEFKNDEDKKIWNFFNKAGILTNGFKRDYAVGLTSNDYIFHLDFDTVYNPKVIKRKLEFLKKNKVECTYCKAMLAYDIYGKELYKLDNKAVGYESTLFHTKEYWNKGGFKWEDIHSEAFSFYYGKGLDRPMDNYYDTIKLLSIHNYSNYKPVKITLENMNINIPDVVGELNVSTHPIQGILCDLFNEKEINVLGLDSEIMEIIKDKGWKMENIKNDGKVKEKNLIKKIKEFDKEFNLCFINTKNPIWSIFKKCKFSCVVLESTKDREQMDSILKQNDYLFFENIYIHSEYLKLNN